jgi:hypothetical protein
MRPARNATPAPLPKQEASRRRGLGGAQAYSSEYRKEMGHASGVDGRGYSGGTGGNAVMEVPIGIGGGGVGLGAWERAVRYWHTQNHERDARTRARTHAHTLARTRAHTCILAEQSRSHRRRPWGQCCCREKVTRKTESHFLTVTFFAPPSLPTSTSGRAFSLPLSL